MLQRSRLRARTFWLRTALLTLTGGASVAAGMALLHLIGGSRPSGLDWLRSGLLVVASFWLLWGTLTGLLGAVAPRTKTVSQAGRPGSRTAILIPVYNEEPMETLARVAAMNRQLVAMGLAESFHFAVLSDTTCLETAAREVATFGLLMREPLAEGRIFYRRREANTGRKSGNIEDFITRSGGAYDYAVILDADSLMEGETLLALVRQMEADPRLGLVQTVPEVIGGQSFFGRMMAFSSAYLSPYFARGAALLQGEEGPFWGHNAIVRVKAFAQCCGLPVLSGKPPYGGHILSHDYVEAALLARGGWKVEVNGALSGSYELGPENLIEYAKRDRRWCQGNLQHRRLILALGLKFWSRFAFLQGLMAYLVSPIWVLLLAASIMALCFPDASGERLPVVAWSLGVGVVGALVLPKLAIALRGSVDGHNRRFGGTLRIALSLVAELLVTTLMAPVLLAFQTRAVIEILLGLDGGWPATARDAREVSLHYAFEASWWMMLLGGGAIGVVGLVSPASLIWILPVSVPALLAPLVICLTSHRGGRVGAALFRTSTEHRPSPVIVESRKVLEGWRSSEALLGNEVAIHA